MTARCAASRICPAATAYRGVHRAAPEGTVRVREVRALIEEAVQLDRHGFSEHDLYVLERMRAIPVDVGSEADRLSTPGPKATAGSEPSPPRSRFDSF